MRIAAFIGWQGGAGGDKSFPDYLRALGLGADVKLDDSEKQAAAARAYDIAQRIARMDSGK